jgi:hypothetical protein
VLQICEDGSVQIKIIKRAGEVRFVTSSAIGLIHVKTCHPSCLCVSVEIRAACGQSGADLT